MTRRHTSSTQRRQDAEMPKSAKSDDGSLDRCCGVEDARCVRSMASNRTSRVVVGLEYFPCEKPAPVRASDSRRGVAALVGWVANATAADRVLGLRLCLQRLSSAEHV